MPLTQRNLKIFEINVTNLKISAGRRPESTNEDQLLLAVPRKIPTSSWTTRILFSFAKSDMIFCFPTQLRCKRLNEFLKRNLNSDQLIKYRVNFHNFVSLPAQTKLDGLHRPSQEPAHFRLPVCDLLHQSQLRIPDTCFSP